MPARGKFLLDTNIVIALLEGDESVLSHLDLKVEIFVPAIVIGELFFGAAKSGRPAENAASVERFAESSAILACDVAVAREYGRLRLHLRQKGRPIPENDIWIAATAVRHGLVLITRDRHFAEVDQLTHAAW